MGIDLRLDKLDRIQANLRAEGVSENIRRMDEKFLLRVLGELGSSCADLPSDAIRELFSGGRVVRMLRWQKALEAAASASTGDDPALAQSKKCCDSVQAVVEKYNDSAVVANARVKDLVERFDIEPLSDF